MPIDSADELAEQIASYLCDRANFGTSSELESIAEGLASGLYREAGGAIFKDVEDWSNSDKEALVAAYDRVSGRSSID